MSTCISQRGEFSSHEPDADHVCTFCGILDEDALIEELRQARESVSSLTAENERLREQVRSERLRADINAPDWIERAKAAEAEEDPNG